MINGTRSRSFAVRELEKVQRTVTQGVLAETRRRELIVRLYREEHLSQVEIANLLSKVSVNAGGAPIGDDAVWKIVKSARSAR